jgi:molybdenum cofactor synthesis domain-containing protein
VALLPLDAAVQHVLSRVGPLPPEQYPLGEALGLVVAETVTSEVAVPPFDNSAMDGFALRSADVAGASQDTPARLRIIETVAAGAVATEAVGPGCAIRIMTGAPLPAGADAVVIVERTTVDGDLVTVTEAVTGGANVRRAGSDLLPGAPVVAAGVQLGPANLSLLATAGVAEVMVTPRPRVGVLSTGDELVAPGAPLGPGQIHDSNRLGLLALIRAGGFEPVDLGWAPDDPVAIEALLRRGAATCDAVVSSGGVSMGDFDEVKAVLDRIGQMRWMQIAIRPAKPFAFGVVDHTPVFGLPGNPVSSLVSFELLARPALRAVAGHPAEALRRPELAAVAEEAFARRADGKTHFVRATGQWASDGRFHVRSAGGQGSHQLTAMAAANALVVLPDGPGVDAGCEVACLVLGT